MDSGGSTERARQIFQEVHQQLKDSELVAFSLTNDNRESGTPIGAVLKSGKFSEVFYTEKPERRPSTDGNSTIPNPGDGDEVLYIAGTGGEPLFDFYVEAAAERAAGRLANALEKMARQNNLRALENRGSTLNASIGVTILKTTGNVRPQGQQLSGWEAIKQRALENQIRLVPGTYYKLQLRNNSPRDIFVTAINISSDGAVQIMYPRADSGQEPLRPGMSVDTMPYMTTRPFGEETFKIIATRQFSDFRPLTQQGIRGKTPGPPSLSALMERAMLGVRNGSLPVVSQGSEWGTSQFSFTIVRE